MKKSLVAFVFAAVGFCGSALALDLRPEEFGNDRKPLDVDSIALEVAAHHEGKDADRVMERLQDYRRGQLGFVTSKFCEFFNKGMETSESVKRLSKEPFDSMAADQRRVFCSALFELIAYKYVAISRTFKSPQNLPLVPLHAGGVDCVDLLERVARWLEVVEDMEYAGHSRVTMASEVLACHNNMVSRYSGSGRRDLNRSVADFGASRSQAGFGRGLNESVADFGASRSQAGFGRGLNEGVAEDFGAHWRQAGFVVDRVDELPVVDVKAKLTPAQLREQVAERRRKEAEEKERVAKEIADRERAEDFWPQGIGGRMANDVAVARAVAAVLGAGNAAAQGADGGEDVKEAARGAREGVVLAEQAEQAVPVPEENGDGAAGDRAAFVARVRSDLAVARAVAAVLEAGNAAAQGAVGGDDVKKAARKAREDAVLAEQAAHLQEAQGVRANFIVRVKNELAVARAVAAVLEAGNAAAQGAVGGDDVKKAAREAREDAVLVGQAAHLPEEGGARAAFVDRVKVLVAAAAPLPPPQ